MKVIVSLVLALALLGAACLAHAEGGCPEGFYPSSDPSIVGCAPIPGYTGSMGEEDEPVVPRISWIKTWGAIALDKDKGIVGAITGEKSERQARKSAIAECIKQGGGAGCKNIAITYKNQCVVALVADSSGLVTVTAESEEKAHASAVALCRKNNKSCQDYYSACSEPIRVQ